MIKVERCPEGSTTTSEADLAASGGILQLARPIVEGRVRGSVRGLFTGFFNFFSAQDLTVLAISANFGARQDDLKAEVRFDRAARFLHSAAEERFDLAAAQADYVGVRLLGA